jgi:WD40 repeat protein
VRASDGPLSDVFLSYARAEDGAVAQRVLAALEARGKDVWIDQQGRIEHGDKWRVALEEAIDGADAIVFLLSPAWTVSTPCRREFEHARDAGKRLVPVIVAPITRDQLPGALGDLPSELEERDWIFLRPQGAFADDDFDAGIGEIIRAAELDPEFTRLHTRVLGRARAWEASGRRVSPLLRGEELRAAEAWRDRSATGAVKPEPIGLQLDFIAASRRAAGRRLIIAGVAATVVAAVAIVLAVGALLERSHAIANQKSALSQALASEAQNQFEFADGDNPAVGTLLSLESYRYAPSDAATASVLTALEDQPDVIGYVPTADEADRVAVDASGRRMTVGEPHSVQEFALPSRQLLLSRRFGSAIVRAVSPDSQLISVAPATAKQLDVYDLSAPDAPTVTIPTTGTVEEAAFSANGYLAFVEVCAGHAFWCLDIWSLSRGHSVFHSTLPAVAPLDLAYAADGSEVATLADNGIVTLFDPRNARHAKLIVPKARLDYVNGNGAIALSSSGNELAAGYDDGVYQLWRIDPTGTATALGPARGYRLGSSAQVSALSFDAGARQLVVGAVDGYTELHTVGVAADRAYVHEDTAQIEGAAFLPGDHEIALAGDDDQVLLWRTGGVSTLGERLPSPGGDVLAAAFSPNDRIVAALGVGGAIRLYDSGSGHPVGPPLRAYAVDETPFELGPPTSPLVVLAFSASGRRLVFADGGGHVRIWGVANPAQPRLITTASFARDLGPDGGDGTVAVDPAATELAIPTARGVLLFDLDALGRPPRRLRYSVPQSSAGMTLAFSHSGTVLAAGDQGRGTIEVWDLAGSGRARTLVPPTADNTYLYTLAFAPDGRELAVAIGGEVSIFQVTQGRRVGTFGSAIDNAGGYVQRIAFSPSGSIIATGDDLGNLRLWGVKSEQEIASPLLSTGTTDQTIYDVESSPDGAQLVVAGTNSSLQLWNHLLWHGTDLGARASRLCAIAGRNLTHAEWDVLVPGASYHRTCSQWPSGA